MRESNEAKVNRLIDKGKMKIVRTGTRSIIIATQAFSFFFFWSRFYASALSGRDTRDPVSKELMGGERGCHESFRIVARRRCNVFRCIRISSFRIIYINPLVFRCSIIGKVFKKISFSESLLADSLISVYIKLIR